MEKNNDNIRTRWKIAAVSVLGVLAALAYAAVIYWVVLQLLPSLTISGRSNTYMTATQIASVRNIGQWEFLSVNAEEIVDTTRQGLFSDNHLVRIYYGTLRLGVDLSAIDSTCVQARGDTLVLTVPDVTLLDDHFIDEARTRPFHEAGEWTGVDRNDLYQRARQKMMARGMTPENMEATRQLAETQLLQLLHALGFEHAEVRFQRR